MPPEPPPDAEPLEVEPLPDPEPSPGLPVLEPQEKTRPTAMAATSEEDSVIVRAGDRVIYKEVARREAGGSRCHTASTRAVVK